MTDRTGALLIELAKLVSRYGPEEFERLADMIGKPEFAASISQILRETARRHSDYRAEANGPRSKKGTRVAKIAFLERLRETDPPRFAILSEIRVRLAEKRALPRLVDVTTFAEKRRYRLEGARSRGQAVTSLLRALVDLPEKELRQVLDEIPTSSEETSDLRGWSDIIMNRPPRQP